MADPNPTRVRYQKLPGQGSRAVQYVRLYLGPDHLLQVTSGGFAETYQRYYFQDIQAIALYHTILGRVINIILACGAAVFLLGGLATGDVGGMIGFGIPATVLLIVLLVNFAQGPTCYCYITTAVQTAKLPSLSRMPRAQKVIDRLRPLIAAAQGDWPAGAGDILQRSPATSPDQPPPPPPPPSPPAPTAPPSPQAAAGADDAPPILDNPG